MGNLVIKSIAFWNQDSLGFNLFLGVPVNYSIKRCNNNNNNAYLIGSLWSE